MEILVLLSCTLWRAFSYSTPENVSVNVHWNVLNHNVRKGELSLEEGSEILYLLSKVGQKYGADAVTLNDARKLQAKTKLSSRLRHSTRNQKNISALSPVSLINTNTNKNSSTSLHVNWHWKIGGDDGFLNIPTAQLVVNGTEQNYELLLDLGLETGSGLVCELFENKNYVFIGIEANLINFGVSYRNILSGNAIGDPHIHLIKDRVLLLPLAISNQTGMTIFNENYSPACGSILESRPNGWWCTHTTNSFHIPAVRLDLLLERVPPNYNFLLLKIDVEGADLLVLQGAGSYTAKFQMVSIECRVAGDTAGDLGRYGACSRPRALAYMTDQGFRYSECTGATCLFWKHEEHNSAIRRLCALTESKVGFAINDCPYNVNRHKIFLEEELQKQKEKKRLKKEGEKVV